MEDRTRRDIDHAIEFFRTKAEEAEKMAEGETIPRMIGYDNGRADAWRLFANFIEGIVRDEDELNGLIPSRDDKCPVCAGKGTEAGRACGACMGRGFFSPSVEVADDERAPI